MAIYYVMYECNCIEEQQAEIELLEAAFGSSFQLLNNNNYDDDECDDDHKISPKKLISYMIKLTDYKFSIQFWLPLHFPKAPLIYSIINTDQLISDLLILKIKALLDSEIIAHNDSDNFSQFRSIDCYQVIINCIHDNQFHSNSNSNTTVVDDSGSITKYPLQSISTTGSHQIKQYIEIKIARFLIYFHHIMR